MQPSAIVGVENQPLSGLRWVPRDTLTPNDYNPNHVAPVEMRLLKRSIMLSGWTQPIVVLNDGRTIIDGFHRWTLSADPDIAAMTGGLVPVVTCNLSVAQRMAATVRHNRARGTHGVDHMGEIIVRMRGTGLPDQQIAAELGMEMEELQRLTETLSLPQKAVSTTGGQLSKAWAPGAKAKRPSKKNING